MNLLQTLIGLSFIYSASTERFPGVKNVSGLCRFFSNEEYALDTFRCQETCEKYGDPTCGGYAPNGDCYCKKGFVRLTENGPCVSPQSAACRSKMPPTAATCEKKQNEELAEYLYHDSPCGNTCANYKVPCDIMVPMVLIWSPYCVCKEGYSRLPNGKCVAIDDPKCYALYKPSKAQCVKRGNEVYRQGSACQQTCADLVATEPKMCIMSIVEDCYCPDGKIRYYENGPCVAKEEC